MKQRVTWVTLRGLHVLEWETEDPKPLLECDCGNVLWSCDDMCDPEDLGWNLGDGFCPACRPKLNRDPDWMPF